MQYVVVDLEWNGAYNKQAMGYFNEIIEIGAVKLNEQMQQTSTFQALIKPVVCRELTELVADMTSLTTADLESGLSFVEAITQFQTWIGTEETVLLTWSTSDLLVLMENCRQFYGDEHIPFLHQYMDLQLYFQKQKKVDLAQQTGLAKACALLEISDEGLEMHRALDDSIQSGRILQKVYEPISFSAQIRVTDETFYARMQFKPTYLSDSTNPLINPQALLFYCEDCRCALHRESEWDFHNRALFADFLCMECGRKYTGRVQCKQKYEGVETKRRLFTRVPLKPEGTGALEL